MLTSINIHDLAVVSALELDFSAGLTVLTGETGAGKSILLTALGLALGNRADSGFIRPGSKRAEVTLQFDLADCKHALDWLVQQDLDDEQQCLIRRVISQTGPSRAYINGRPTTLQSLQELSAFLLEIHGQHAHLKLLSGNEQRRLLDEYGSSTQANQQLNRLVQEWQTVTKELHERETALHDSVAKVELLRYQINEFEQYEIDSLDYNAISDEHRRLTHLDTIRITAQSELNQLYESDEASTYSQLDSSVQAVSEIQEFASELDNVVSLLTEARIAVEEAARSLRHVLDHQVSDPQRLSSLEDSLNIFHDLARKHQIKPEDLSNHLQILRYELDKLDSSEETLVKLRENQQQLAEKYLSAAKKLSEKRAKTAKNLAKEVSQSIVQLGMPQGEFVIDIEQKQDSNPQLNGTDEINFLISSNPGLPPRTLNKVASGGELSRISLAIQVAITSTRSAATMIFDEVDSGIGGGTAQIVGNLLRKLGDSRQVLCVTHLPQVAAQGHQHLLVEKSNDGATTESSVKPLPSAERKLEIARMLGGIEITEQTLSHAEEMLDWGD